MLKLFLLLAYLYPVTHDFYSSITILEYNETTQRFEIISKYFEDDFSEFMTSKWDQYEFNERVQEKSKEIIRSHFALQIDGVNLSLKIIGMKKENDILFLFMESEPIKSSGKLRISNRLLLSSFEDQIHITQLKTGTYRRTETISKRRTSVSFKWPQDKQD